MTLLRITSTTQELADLAMVNLTWEPLMRWHNIDMNNLS
jgi:hypothetical protein